MYNFHNAQKAARAENFLYVFEGFMDVIAGYKVGIVNSVAAMGTAFTEDHVKKILNTSKNVVLCFDGDEAGINALRKTVALFSRFNIIPDAVILPNGMDPDEYLNKFGKDALLSYLKINHKNALELLYENAHGKTIPFAGKSISVILLFEKAPLSILITSFSNTTFSRPQQLNAYSPTLVTLSGSAISVIPAQPKKVLSPIVVTPLGMVMLVRFEQSKQRIRV